MREGGVESRAMETPLTPLEFLRRARKLHRDRTAVVDGSLRWSYGQFGERCDRWSAALQALGVAPGALRQAGEKDSSDRRLESKPLARGDGGESATAYSVRSDGDDNLYRIDLGTGVATAVGPVGFDDVEFREDDIVRCVEHLPHGMRFEPRPDEKVQVARDALVLRVR